MLASASCYYVNGKSVIETSTDHNVGLHSEDTYSFVKSRKGKEVQGPFFPSVRPTTHSADLRPCNDATDYEIAYLTALNRGLPIFETVPEIRDCDIQHEIDSLDEGETILDAIDRARDRRIETGKTISELWVMRYLGQRYWEYVPDIVNDALILWIELDGLTSPKLCLKRTMLDFLKRNGIEQKIFTPLTLDLELRLGRSSTGMTVRDLPDNLQLAASWKLAGLSYEEIQERFRLSPRDVSNAIGELREYLGVKSKRGKHQRMEFSSDPEKVAGDAAKQQFTPLTEKEREKRLDKEIQFFKTTYANNEELQLEQQRQREAWNRLHGPQFQSITVTKNGETVETLKRID